MFMNSFLNYEIEIFLFPKIWRILSVINQVQQKSTMLFNILFSVRICSLFIKKQLNIIVVKTALCASSYVEGNGYKWGYISVDTIRYSGMKVDIDSGSNHCRRVHKENNRCDSKLCI